MTSGSLWNHYRDEVGDDAEDDNDDEEDDISEGA